MKKATIEAEPEELEEMSKTKAKSRSEQAPPTGLRLPDEMKEAIEEQAEKEGVSFGEMCRRFLQDGLTKDPDRERATLVKSLAITEAQLKRASERKTITGADTFIKLLGHARAAIEKGEHDLGFTDGFGFRLD